MDHVSAAVGDSSYAVIAAGHADGPSHDGAGMIAHHCVNPGQCTGSAVLSASVTISPRASTRVSVAADQLGVDRAISPHRRPPKIRQI